MGYKSNSGRSKIFKDLHKEDDAHFMLVSELFSTNFLHISCSFSVCDESSATGFRDARENGISLNFRGITVSGVFPWNTN